ncbi:hypothetical protein RF55_12147 [Lasius niger]|uniref:DUF4780 domain-containing protein n=1 Tax=Lasius niger TaxID=67767 RepID=A0A0J7KDV8_LASNI|nr:hypothetical protein RF55_12147 [Lasius niger]
MWEGSGLTIVGFDEFPKFVRVSAFLPGPAPADKKTILGKLERQNPRLRTGRWSVYEPVKEAPAKGTRLVLGVEKTALPVLEKLGMRPFYGMGRATFQVLRNKPDPRRNKEGDKRPNEGESQDRPDQPAS